MLGAALFTTVMTIAVVVFMLVFTFAWAKEANVVSVDMEVECQAFSSTAEEMSTAEGRVSQLLFLAVSTLKEIGQAMVSGDEAEAERLHIVFLKAKADWEVLKVEIDCCQVWEDEVHRAFQVWEGEVHCASPELPLATHVTYAIQKFPLATQENPLTTQKLIEMYNSLTRRDPRPQE